MATPIYHEKHPIEDDLLPIEDDKIHIEDDLLPIEDYLLHVEEYSIHWACWCICLPRPQWGVHVEDPGTNPYISINGPVSSTWRSGCGNFGEQEKEENKGL